MVNKGNQNEDNTLYARPGGYARLYGTTLCDGKTTFGSVFEITP
jgi:hypothetical protein